MLEVTICGNCHIRGHRSDGNKKNDKCNAPPCTSYFMCGQKKKHSEHFQEIKKRKRELKEVTRRDRAASFRVGGLKKNA